MSNLFNGNNIILDKVEETLIKEKGKLTIDYSQIKYFAKEFKKIAGSGYQVSRSGVGPLIRKACSKCGILSKGPDVIEKILKG